MLPRDNRLKDKNIILSVFKTGDLKRTPFFNLYYKNIFPPPQILVTISNRVEKKAVVRNRLRRQIQEVFKEIIGSLHSSAKIVIVVHKEIIGKDYYNIKQEIESAINKK